MVRYSIKEKYGDKISRTESFKYYMILFNFIEYAEFDELDADLQYFELEIAGETFEVYGKISYRCEVGRDLCNVNIFGDFSACAHVIKALQDNGNWVNLYLKDRNNITIGEGGIYDSPFGAFIAKNKCIKIHSSDRVIDIFKS